MQKAERRINNTDNEGGQTKAVPVSNIKQNTFKIPESRKTNRGEKPSEDEVKQNTFKVPGSRKKTGKKEVQPAHDYESAGRDIGYSDDAIDAFNRYNIDPDTFSADDLNKWANKHNFNMSVDSSMRVIYTPKYKGFKKQTTKQDEKDLKILEALASNNARRNLAQNDSGALAAGAVSAGQNILFGFGAKMADVAKKQEYKKAGLDEADYVSPGQAWAKTQSTHKVASTLGAVAPSLIDMYLMGGLTESVLSKLPKYAQISKAAVSGTIRQQEAARKILNTINTVSTIGATTGVSSAVGQDWNKKDWPKQVGNVVLDTAVSSFGAYLGSGASRFIGRKTVDVLAKTNLAPRVIAALSGANSALSFSAATTGASELKNIIKAAIKKEEYKPDWTAIATNAVVFAIFAGVKAYANSKQSTSMTGVEEKFEYFTEEDMASLDALKKKRNQYARQYHSDITHDANTEDILARINAEYDRALSIAKLNTAKGVYKKFNDIQNGTGMSEQQGTQGTQEATDKAIMLLNELNEQELSEIKSNIAENSVPVPVFEQISAGTSAPATPSEAPKASETIPNAVPEEDTASAKAFATKTASKEIKNIERKLVLRGAGDRVREKIVNMAIDIEKQLEGSERTVTDVFNGIASAISKNGGAKNADEYWGKFCDRLEKLSPQQTASNELIDENAGKEMTDSENAKAVMGTDEENSPDAKEAPIDQYAILGKLGLTYDEKNAIINYKGSRSYKINEELYDDMPLTETDKEFTAQVNKALDKFPNYEGKVYRYEGYYRKEDFIDLVNEHKKQSEITKSAFISTSKDIDGYKVDAEYTILYEIDSVSGKDVSDIGVKSEREVLFKAGTRFEILDISVKGKKAIIKLKELIENEISRTDSQEGNIGRNLESGEQAGLDGKGQSESVGISGTGRGSTNDVKLSESPSGGNSENADIREKVGNHRGYGRDVRGAGTVQGEE